MRILRSACFRGTVSRGGHSAAGFTQRAQRSGGHSEAYIFRHVRRVKRRSITISLCPLPRRVRRVKPSSPLLLCSSALFA